MSFPKDIFAEYAVEASSLEDFLNRYYRHDRYKGRGEEYAAAVLKSNSEYLEKYGIAWIDSKSSATGATVSYIAGTV